MRTLLICVAALAVFLTATAATPPADAAAGSPRACRGVKKRVKRTARCSTSRRACRAASRPSACARSKSRRSSRRRPAVANRTQPARSAPAAGAPGASSPSPSGGSATSPSASTPNPPGVSPGSSAAPSSRLFAADSVWNAALDDSAPLDPTSATRMAAVNTEVQAEIAGGTGPWITESSYSTPLYKVTAGQPKVHVTLDTGSWGANLQEVLDEGVPIPSDARPANGTDGHMTIYQPSSDTLWEFWRAVKKPDGWHASWGGAMRDVSRNPGYYTNAAWPTLAEWEGWNWGSTATSLPMIAGTIMMDELRRGRIDHALALDIPDACAQTFSWPAQRTDGGLTTPDCLPEGAHLRLDPRLDLSTLALPRVTRILAEAAQRYGMIVRDKTNHAFGFYAEDPTRTGTEPYWGPDGLYDGLAPWDFLPKFPWDRLQLLKMTLCIKAPCMRAPMAASASAAHAAKDFRPRARRSRPRRPSRARKRRAPTSKARHAARGATRRTAAR